MAQWNINGFLFVLYKVDHPPFHVHVFKDGHPIGKFDLEKNVWMKGPYHAANQAHAALKKWRETFGY